MSIQSKFPEAKRAVGMVHWITAGNSGYCTLEDGSQAFIHARIVSKLKLGDGDKLNVSILPNYKDKQATCPHRVVFVHSINGEDLEEHPMLPTIIAHAAAKTDEEDPRTEEQEAPTGTPSLEDQIVKLTENGDLYTTKELSDYLRVGILEARNACDRLHRQELLARSDIFRRYDQSRATVTLWGRSVSDFLSTG